MNIYPKNNVNNHAIVQDLNFAIESINHATNEFSIEETVRAIAEGLPAGQVADAERFYGLGSKREGLSQMKRARGDIENALKNINRAIECIESHK